MQGRCVPEGRWSCGLVSRLFSSGRGRRPRRRLVGREVEIPEEDRPRHDGPGGRRQGGPHRFPRARAGSIRATSPSPTPRATARTSASSPPTTRPRSSTISSGMTRQRRWSSSGSRSRARLRLQPGLHLGLLRQRQRRGRQDAGGTFDTSQLAVYHLGEKEGLPQDATSYKNHGKEFTGKLGAPCRHRPRHHPERRGRPPRDREIPLPQLRKGLYLLRLGPHEPPPGGRPPLLLGRREASVVIAVEGTKLYCHPFGAEEELSPTSRRPAPSKWVHVAVTADAGKGPDALYGRTGESHARSLPGPFRSRPPISAFGASLQGKNGFAGDLDEIGLAGVARSAAWVRAAAVGQGPETPLLSYLEEESSSGGGREPDHPPPRRHRQGHHPGRMAHHRRHRDHDRPDLDPLLQQVHCLCAS